MEAKGELQRQARATVKPVGVPTRTTARDVGARTIAFAESPGSVIDPA